MSDNGQTQKKTPVAVVDADAIGSVMGGILQKSEEDRQAAFGRLLDLPSVEAARRYVSAGDYGMFSFTVSYRLEGFVDTVLSGGVCKTHQAKFIFKNSGYVERQFTEIYRDVEGSACCVDKARTVVRALIEFYEHGTRIDFDRSNLIAFWLPQRVLREHDQIVAFFEGVHSLYAGRREKYLAALRDAFSVPIAHAQGDDAPISAQADAEKGPQAAAAAAIVDSLFYPYIQAVRGDVDVPGPAPADAEDLRMGHAMRIVSKVVGALQGEAKA